MILFSTNKTIVQKRQIEINEMLIETVLGEFDFLDYVPTSHKLRK